MTAHSNEALDRDALEVSIARRPTDLNRVTQDLEVAQVEFAAIDEAWEAAKGEGEGVGVGAARASMQEPDHPMRSGCAFGRRQDSDLLRVKLGSLGVPGRARFPAQWRMVQLLTRIYYPVPCHLRYCRCRYRCSASQAMFCLALHGKRRFSRGRPRLGGGPSVRRSAHQPCVRDGASALSPRARRASLGARGR